MSQRPRQKRPGENPAPPSFAGEFTRFLSRPAAVSLCLAAITFAVYWPVLGFDFVGYDDHDYFTDNPHIQSGLTWSSVQWAFGAFFSSNWHPLTWISLMLDQTLFGDGPAGPHLTNLLLHTASGILLFLWLRRLTLLPGRSAFVAMLFLLHPLHVESVAWVAERKDVLSAFFWLLTLRFYTRYAQSEFKSRASKIGNYLVVLACFILGLLSKAMLVTLPCVMLLLDFWPLQRSSSFPSPIWGRQRNRSAMGHWPGLILEKIPFFALSAAASLLTWLAQKAGGAVAPMAALTWEARIENAFISYARYLGKTFWPVDLACPYPHPGHWPAGQVVLAAVLILGISLLAIGLARRQPYFLFGWCWYWGALIPVIGLVQVGAQAMADRYSYVPLIGIFILLVWGVGEGWEYLRIPPLGGAAMACFVTLACAWRAGDQVLYWQNSETVLCRAVEVTHNYGYYYYPMGDYLARLGCRDKASECFRQALEMNPSDPVAHNDLGVILLKKKQYAEAISHFQAAIQFGAAGSPGAASAHENANAHCNLGVALLETGRPEAACEQYRIALNLEPDHTDAHYNYGRVLADLDQLPAAIEQYKKAWLSNPKKLMVHNDWGIALARQGRWDEAANQLQLALGHGHDDAATRCNLGNVLAHQHRYEAAAAQYAGALRLRPQYPEAQNNLGCLLMEQGKWDEAARCFETAIRWEPDYADAHGNLGEVMAKLGRRNEALVHFQEAVRLKPDTAAAREQLRRLGTNAME